MIENSSHDDELSCGRCNGDGDVSVPGKRRYTCPTCRGSGLSSLGEIELRKRSEKRGANQE